MLYGMSHYGRSHCHWHWSPPDLTGCCHGSVTSHTEDSHLSHVTLVPALGNHCSDYCATVPLRLLPHCQHCKHGRVTAWHSTGPHPGWRAPLLSLGAAGAVLAPIPHRSHDFRIILCPSYISTETLLHTATSVPLHQPATCCFNTSTLRNMEIKIFAQTN